MTAVAFISHQIFVRLHPLCPRLLVLKDPLTWLPLTVFSPFLVLSPEWCHSCRVSFLQCVCPGCLQGRGRDGGNVWLSSRTQRGPVWPDDSTDPLSEQQVSRDSRDWAEVYGCGRSENHMHTVCMLYVFNSAAVVAAYWHCKQRHLWEWVFITKYVVL